MGNSNSLSFGNSSSPNISAMVANRSFRALSSVRCETVDAKSNSKPIDAEQTEEITEQTDNADVAEAEQSEDDLVCTLRNEDEDDDRNGAGRKRATRDFETEQPSKRRKAET